jgi:hypothetical protein
MGLASTHLILGLFQASPSRIAQTRSSVGPIGLGRFSPSKPPYEKRSSLVRNPPEDPNVSDLVRSLGVEDMVQLRYVGD